MLPQSKPIVEGRQQRKQYDKSRRSDRGSADRSSGRAFSSQKVALEDVQKMAGVALATARVHVGSLGTARGAIAEVCQAQSGFEKASKRVKRQVKVPKFQAGVSRPVFVRRGDGVELAVFWGGSFGPPRRSSVPYA